MSNIADFDPNAPGDHSGNIFGLPFSAEEANIIILPVPWDVTVSYHDGTAKGPEAILEASFQVDLEDPFVPRAWEAGICMTGIAREWVDKSSQLRQKAAAYIRQLESGAIPDSNSQLSNAQQEINNACRELNEWVKQQALSYLKQNKTVAVLGGDHSTPLGLLHALAEKHSSFSILQIDAHMDLRKAYEGLEYSHASIMYNALKIPQIKHLAQVGIRDYCEEENRLRINSNGRITTFFDHELKEELFKGTRWDTLCDKIIATLPEKVYISFDIDGLDPKLCPNTGTPVPGGLNFDQAVYLVKKLTDAGKVIIGFDLNEVAPGNNNDWDANVGARLLYKLCNLTAKSQGIA